ncbi:ComEC/Rec2 family competence protein [Megasphaera paucivorans]|uniref:Competence protein ComEC n=1 Tax=Megasphaera paucivorans TaxID=349095 RepID=A0A1G9UJJ7_9FIRM|nr:ComEC/Rec2 family competence protein [Megasphaera paucivorans]SDM60076.1 competence protein ComEC [Megasphaera paucivorans]
MIYFSLVLATACCGGIATAEILHLQHEYYIAGLVINLIAMGAMHYRKKMFFLFLIPLFFFLGASRLQYVSEEYHKLPAYLIGHAIYMEGVIEEQKNTYESDKGKVTRYVFSLTQFSYKGENVRHAASGRVYITLPALPSCLPSSHIGVTGSIHAVKYYKNTGMYDALHRDREQYIIGTVYVDTPQDIRYLKEASGWPLFAWNIRENMTRNFMTILSKENSYLLSSLLFGGHYEDLPKILINSFSTTGLIHILSVSGSHVSLLLSIVQLIGGFFGLRERRLFILSAVLVVFYGALSNFTAPVIRSVIMGLISAYSLVARRDYTSCHALAAAVIVMVLYSPYLLYDLSFQLSCGASAGIVLLQQPVRKKLTSLPNFLQESLTVCISAQILLVPFLFANFFSFPLYSFLANLIIGPVLDSTIVLGLIAAFLGIFFTPGMTVLLWIINPLLTLAVNGNYFIAALPYSRIWSGALSLSSIVAYYIFVGTLFFPLPKKKKLILFSVFLVSINFLWRQWNRPEAVIYVFDMGNDRATCSIHSDSSVHVWYNKSQWSNPEQIACVLTPALRHKGIFSLDTAYISGYEAKQTAQQLTEQFSIGHLTTVPAGKEYKQSYYEAVAGRVPYYIYDTISHGIILPTACIEIRSLRHGTEKIPFPKEAAALILFRSGKGDMGWETWQEEAAYYGIPCFSPFRTGEIIAVFRKGKWRFSSYGGDSE